MGRVSHAEFISETAVMVHGIRNNQTVLSKRQIDGAFADKLETAINLCVSLNNEQEALKAKLKEKTEELEAAHIELHRIAGEARAIIKLDMPHASWKEFGINDKR